MHALAKLLGRTSREVMAALLDLGFAARSVQYILFIAAKS